MLIIRYAMPLPYVVACLLMPPDSPRAMPPYADTLAFAAIHAAADDITQRKECWRCHTRYAAAMLFSPYDDDMMLLLMPRHDAMAMPPCRHY